MDSIDPRSRGVLGHRRSPRARVITIAVAAAVLVGVSGGVAAAVIPSAGVITVCATRSGTLRLIDADTTTCRSSETTLSWNIQGAAGAAGANGVSGYEIVYDDTVIPDSTTYIFASATATCPEGKVALGGGVEFRGGGVPISSSASNVHATAPTSDGTGWTVGYDTLTHGVTGIDTIRVYATCALAG